MKNYFYNNTLAMIPPMGYDMTRTNPGSFGERARSLSNLSAGNWLYFELYQKDGEILPKEEEPAAIAGGGEPAATTDGGVLGLLTITITCIAG